MIRQLLPLVDHRDAWTWLAVVSGAADLREQRTLLRTQLASAAVAASPQNRALQSSWPADHHPPTLAGRRHQGLRGSSSATRCCSAATYPRVTRCASSISIAPGEVKHDRAPASVAHRRWRMPPARKLTLSNHVRRRQRQLRAASVRRAFLADGAQPGRGEGRTLTGPPAKQRVTCRRAALQCQLAHRIQAGRNRGHQQRLHLRAGDVARPWPNPIGTRLVPAGWWRDRPP